MRIDIYEIDYNGNLIERLISDSKFQITGSNDVILIEIDNCMYTVTNVKFTIVENTVSNLTGHLKVDNSYVKIKAIVIQD